MANNQNFNKTLKSAVDFSFAVLANFLVIVVPLYLVHQAAKLFIPDSAKDPKANPYTMQIISNSLEMATAKYLGIFFMANFMKSILNFFTRVRDINAKFLSTESEFTEIQKSNIIAVDKKIAALSKYIEKKSPSSLHTPQNLEPVLQDTVLAAMLTVCLPQYTATIAGLALSQATVKTMLEKALPVASIVAADTVEAQQEEFVDAQQEGFVDAQPDPVSVKRRNSGKKVRFVGFDEY